MRSRSSFAAWRPILARSWRERAAHAGADYVTLSPIFATASKPGHGPALGPDGLAHVAARLAVPVIALAGVGADNAAACLDAGAAGVAAMGAVMRAADPRAATATLIDGIKPVQTSRQPSG